MSKETIQTNVSRKHTSNSVLLKRFSVYLFRYKWILALDLCCAALTTICELVLPMIVRYLTNLGMNDVTSLSMKLILQIGLFYIFLRVIDSVANFYMAYTGHVMGVKIETDMRRDIFHHVQELSFSFFDNTKVGQIMARVTTDLFDIAEFAHHCPEEYFVAAIKVTGAFIICLNMNVPLTLIVFAIVPLMLVCSLSFRKVMRTTSKKSKDQIGDLNAQAEDSLLGIRVVKSFANEDIEIAKFEKGNQAFYENKKKMYLAFAGFQTTTRTFDGIMYITVVLVGSLFMYYGKIGPGDLIAYLLYVTTLLTSIRRIVEFTEQFQKGITGVERFMEIIEAPVEIKSAQDAVVLDGIQGDIVFDNVSFAYEEDQEKILSGINIHVRPGEHIALAGPSGGGKTTLCSLIPRFYDVTSGRVLVDGIDVREIDLKSLRSYIGVVQQDVYLFSGTVFENIQYGKPNASRDEVEEAAKKAGIHDFIQTLPETYNTYVGERGVKLSGGQKQRISIARVFLKNPPVLILDEATSALDNESERLVQASLEELAKGRTTFTIAHRLTTIKNADKILVLTAEGIEEEGSHRELIKKNGIYAGLYEMYAEA